MAVAITTQIQKEVGIAKYGEDDYGSEVITCASGKKI